MQAMKVIVFNDDYDPYQDGYGYGDGGGSGYGYGSGYGS